MSPIRCDICEVASELRVCADCGAEADVIDCGHHAQPAEIAASAYGDHRYVCEYCEEARTNAHEEVHCECGKWSGVRCDWSGPRSEAVIVEWMPNWLRASHEAAGNVGVYPMNGSSRILVQASCADYMVELDGEWCRIVEAPR